MLNRLSILHVLAPGDAGGLQSVVRLLALGHHCCGYAVRVAAILDEGFGAHHPFVTSLHEDGVEVAALPLPGRAYLRERAMIAELCEQHRPSVVHTHGYRPDVLDSGVARRLGIPTVTTVHGFTGGGWRNRAYEHLQRCAFRRFDAVVAVSRALAESLAASGVRRNRIHVVPNAYRETAQLLSRTDARRELSVPEDSFVVGWVGRLSQEKGGDVLVKALTRLANVPLRVSVFGDGPELETLSRRAAGLGLGDRITWHGVVHEAASFFRAFDVFVLSSRTEGTPIVLFEAMSAGIPIVATQVGGVPDVVSPTEALIVPPEDPAALAEAVLNVYRDPGGAASRARAARDRLRVEFQPGPWLARYEALYRQIQRPGAERSS